MVIIASFFSAKKLFAPFISKESGMINFFLYFIKSIGVLIFEGISWEIFL